MTSVFDIVSQNMDWNLELPYHFIYEWDVELFFLV